MGLGYKERGDRGKGEGVVGRSTRVYLKITQTAITSSVTLLWLRQPSHYDELVRSPVFFAQKWKRFGLGKYIKSKSWERERPICFC